MLKRDDKIARLLIAYDGSGYSHAILNELQYSGLPDKSEAHIISVSEAWLPVKHQKYEVFSNHDVTEYFRGYREQMNRNLAETKVVVSEARQELLTSFPDWNVSTEAVSGSPAREILSRANRFQPDLIIAAARGLSSDRGTGLGSISQKILNAANCSVRISRPKPDISHFGLKIIIGFDASEGSMAAVRTVALRSWKLKPEIRLIAVTDPFILLKPGRVFQPIAGMSEGNMKGEREWVETQAVNALKTLLDANLSATLHIAGGNPRMVLAREADRWGADSVFMGANSIQSRQEPYGLGCVALAIAARSKCSVEVVRTTLGN